MGKRCFFWHQFGLPRLDRDGVAIRVCVRCGKMERCVVNLAPDPALAASLEARRAQAIEELGDKWVGKPAKRPVPKPDREAISHDDPPSGTKPPSSNRAA